MKRVLPSLGAAAALALLLAFWVVWYNARLLGPGGWIAALPGLLLAVGIVFSLFAAAGGVMGEMGAAARAAEELQRARADAAAAHQALEAVAAARDRARLAEQLHCEVVALVEGDDPGRVVLAAAKTLEALGAEFEWVGVRARREEGEFSPVTRVVRGSAEPMLHPAPLDPAISRELWYRWERGEAWERVADREALGFGEVAHRGSIVIIDLPFAEGSLEIGLHGEPGANAAFIEVLWTLLPQVSLGYRRTRKHREQGQG